MGFSSQYGTGGILPIVYRVGQKTNPSDYAVYTARVHVYLYKQYSISIVSFYTRWNQNLINVLKFYTEILRYHPSTPESFLHCENTLGPSDDVFVSMTAFRSSKSWEISLSGSSFLFDFCWMLCCLLDCILTRSHACDSVLVWQSAVVPHQSSVQSGSFSAFCTDLQQSRQPTSWLKTLYKYVLYFIPYVERQI